LSLLTSDPFVLGGTVAGEALGLTLKRDLRLPRLLDAAGGPSSSIEFVRRPKIRLLDGDLLNFDADALRTVDSRRFNTANL